MIQYVEFVEAEPWQPEHVVQAYISDRTIYIV